MEDLKLWDKTPLHDENIKDQIEPSLKTYPAEGKKNPAVIVCPGGAYAFLARVQEGNDAAEWMQRLGISAYLLEYRYAPYRHPCPLMDLQRAIRYLRHNAEKLNLDPEKIGVMGFSAGGHLAGSASVHFNDCFCPTDDIDKESARPDFSILAYPAVSADKPFAHWGCVENLLGEKASDLKETDYYSLEKNIPENAPPFFIWHSSEDDCVNVENSYVLASALSKKKVPVELHVYPFGPHGVGRADGRNCADLPHLALWTENCEKWLADIVKII